jgi:hypothetical protein
MTFGVDGRMSASGPGCVKSVCEAASTALVLVVPSGKIAGMADEDLKAELERLRKENTALKKGASSNVRMKVSEKGVVGLWHGALSGHLVQGTMA